jgi:hypothetical protein
MQRSELKSDVCQSGEESRKAKKGTHAGKSKVACVIEQKRRFLISVERKKGIR